jgi:hypothetical protein
VSATGDSAGGSHGFDKSFLIVARLFARQFHFYVKCFAVRNTMAENIGFALPTDINEGAVLRVELTDCVVSRHAAVLAQGCDDLVL